MMERILAGVAAGGFAAVAIVMAPPAAAGPERDFLDALASGGLSFPASATGAVLNGGHSVCQGLASGDSYKEAIAGVSGAMGGNSRLAGTFVRAAVSNLCPNYASELP